MSSPRPSITGQASEVPTMRGRNRLMISPDSAKTKKMGPMSVGSWPSASSRKPGRSVWKAKPQTITATIEAQSRRSWGSLKR